MYQCVDQPINGFIGYKSLQDLKALGERIRYAAQKLGGNDSLSAETGIPLRTIGNYIAGTNEIKALALLNIARAAGLSIDWLLTGTGNPEGFSSKSQSSYEGMPKYINSLGGITPDLIKETVTILYKHLEDNQLKMAPHLFGESVALAVEVYAKAGIKDHDLAKRLLTTIVSNRN